MEELKICLNYNPDHFREIYYRNGQGNILKHKAYRNVIIIPIGFIIITAIIYFISNKYPGISWLFGLGLAISFATAIYAVIAIVKYAKWKLTTEAFLKRMSKYKTYTISVTENAIEVILDSEITIHKWENIKSAWIEPDYIIFHDQEKQGFFIPAKSMKSYEFERLKEVITTKVKQ